MHLGLLRKGVVFSVFFLYNMFFILRNNMRRQNSVRRICLGTAMPDRQSIYVDMAFPETNNDHKFKALLILKDKILKLFAKCDSFVFDRDVFKSIVETASKEIDLTDKFSKPIFAESFGLLVKILANSYELKNRGFDVRNIEQIENHLCSKIPGLKLNYFKYKNLQILKQKDFDEIIGDFQDSSSQP